MIALCLATAERLVVLFPLLRITIYIFKTLCLSFFNFYFANISLHLTFVQVPPQMGQMGGVPVMAPQPMMYNQPVLRPTNPFAPMPGAQVTLIHF